MINILDASMKKLISDSPGTTFTLSNKESILKYIDALEDTIKEQHKNGSSCPTVHEIREGVRKQYDYSKAGG